MRPGRLLAISVLAFAGFMAVFPLFWTALNAFKNNVDIIVRTPKFIFQPTLANVSYILGRSSVLDALMNSVIISVSAVLIGLLLGLPTAYAMVRYPNRWTKDLQFFVLSIRFLPPVAVAIPLMVIWLQLGLYDSLTSLIVTYSLVSISVTIWLAIPSFQRVAKEVEEAAFVDGYGPYAVFGKVALPIASKTLIGAVAFSFVLIWNEFLFALMLTSGNAKTLPIVASELSQQGMNVPWGILNASVLLLSLPPLLFLGVLSGFLNSSFRKSLSKANLMKALVLERKGELSLRDIDLAERLGPNDLRIAIKVVGVCGSDVHYYTHGAIGDFVVNAPMVLGHEAAGLVVEVGSDVRDFVVGDRVCMEPGVPVAGSRASKLGIYNVDPDLTFWATPPIHGVLRPEVVHPAAFTYKLPEGVSLAEGAMVEPFAIGMQAAARARIAPGDTAAVIGCGTIGIMTALAALAGGCARVFVGDLSAEKLEIAAQYPGIIPVDVSKQPLADAVLASTGGWGADIVFEASGSGAVFPDLFKPVRPGGAVVLIGLPLHPVSFNVARAIAKEVRIETVFRYANVFERSLELIASGKVDLKRLITGTYSFANSIDAFERAAKALLTDVKLQIEFPESTT